MYFADFEFSRGFPRISPIALLPDIFIHFTKWIPQYLRIFGYFFALKMTIVLAVCKQQMFEKKKKQKIFDEIHEVKEMFWHFFSF